MKVGFSRICVLGILLSGILASNATAQIERLPIDITELQNPEPELREFKGELYFRNGSGHIFRFDGTDVQRVDPTGGSPRLLVDHFLEVVGDYLYYAGWDGVWRTDGVKVERVAEFHEDVGIDDDDLHTRIHRIGDSIYVPFTRTGADGHGFVKISPDGVSFLLKPDDADLKIRNTVTFRDKVIISNDHSPPGDPESIYYILADDEILPLTSEDLGFGERPFHMVGVSQNYLYFRSKDENQISTLFRSDLDTTEAMFSLEGIEEGRVEVFESGAQLHLFLGDSFRVWTEDDGLRDLENPHPDGAVWRLANLGLYDDDHWLGETSGVLWAFFENEPMYVRLGKDGPERIPDLDRLEELTSRGDFPLLTRLGWCTWNAPSVCVNNGQQVHPPFTLHGNLGEFEGRLYYAGEGGLHSLSASGDVSDYRLESAIVHNNVQFLGKLGDRALIKAAFPGSDALGVLWTTDGKDAHSVHHGRDNVFFQMSDGETGLFRSAAEGFWTYDGDRIGNVQEFFRGPVPFTFIDDYEDYLGDQLFTVRWPVEHQGLWKRGDNGTVKLASFGHEIVVTDSIAYVLAAFTDRDLSVFAYDGDELKFLAEIDGASRFATRVQIPGNGFFIKGDGKIWKFHRGEVTTVEGYYDFYGSVVHDDGMLYFEHKGNVWRTDGDSFEEFLVTEDRPQNLATYDGTLFARTGSETFRHRIIAVRDGEPTLIQEGESFVGFLPPSNHGQFAHDFDRIYRVEMDGLKPISEESLKFLGWVGDHMLVQKPEEPGVFSIRMSGSSVDSEDDLAERPAALGIESYPNPVQSLATVRLDVPSNLHVAVNVRDALGRLVKTLHEGPMQAGQNTLNLNAGELAAGVYFIRATTSDESTTRSIVVSGVR